VKVERVGGGGHLLAVLLSLAFHGLIAAGIAFYINYAPAPDEMARLDLSHVDLSFAETPDETAAVASDSAPMPLSQPPSPPAPQFEPPPVEPVGRTVPCAPQPDTTDLPLPEEPREKLEERRDNSIAQPPTSDPQPSPAVAPRQAKVDVPPQPRRNIRPDYPRESRQRGERGDVTLEIDVNGEGAVDDARVVQSSGFPLLDEAAAKAARAARFTPAKSGGKPVPSTARLTFNFNLK